MNEYKEIINYILDNDGISLKTVVKNFKHLFINIESTKFYGIQLNDDLWKITYLDESNNEVKRYETNISKQLKLNN